KVVNKDLAKKHRKLAEGLYSIPGVTSGKLLFIKSLDALANGEIKPTHNDIVVSYVTTNTWSQYLANIKGLITREGSPSSHSILLAREKKIPCVIGIHENFENLVKMNGQIVTIDGINRIIYEGKVPTKNAKAEDLA